MPVKPALSVVIPVYNEEQNLEMLFTRLTAVLDKLDRYQPYEIIFTNDGSRDGSSDKLRELYQRRPDNVRVIEFSGNFGQHMAVIAGFTQSQGAIVITLDADLQNPPEEIPKLLAAIAEGHDMVEGVRLHRQDSWFRRHASKLNNFLRAKLTGIHLTDQGSMLRAYKRDVINLIVASQETSIFIPSLAYSYANNPGEVIVEHQERATGHSKYNLYRLLRLNFDLITGHSLIPLQFFTFFGIMVSLLSFLFVIYLGLRRIFNGPEADGLFTLFAIVFLLMGVLLFGLGIMGEYIGRIYVEVRKRPRYLIKQVLGAANTNKENSDSTAS